MRDAESDRSGVSGISCDALYPLHFGASNLAGAREYLQDRRVQLVVDFFRDKGIEALKQEDQREAWYADWMSYQAKNRLYAGLLSPAHYSSGGSCFSLAKLTRLLEVFAYFSPAHGVYVAEPSIRPSNGHFCESSCQQTYSTFVPL